MWWGRVSGRFLEGLGGKFPVVIRFSPREATSDSLSSGTFCKDWIVSM